MRIEVFEQQDGLYGGREVWVRVLSNEAHDWRSVEEKLSDEQRVVLNDLGTRTMRYYPFTPTAEDKADHGYVFEDMWVWGKPQ